jgi:dipeptidyl aminopeptidase/acylaminoacyl peptidase
VEYLHWSPNGRQILLGVAGHGADIAGGQGAITSKQIQNDAPTWLPTVETGKEAFRWRRTWVYDLATDSIRQVSPSDRNVWEAAWCGNDSIAAIVSPGPSEGIWYSAHLEIIDCNTGRNRTVYVPRDQLGWPAVSPSGQFLAVVEAVCSDRWIVAGELLLIDTHTGNVTRIDTKGVDVTFLEWRSERKLLLAGHRGYETTIALYDTGPGTYQEIWSSDDVTAVGRYIAVSGVGEEGECVLIAESFTRAPEIATIRLGQYRTVKSFDVGYSNQVAAIAGVQQVRWSSPDDGLPLEGWLLRPAEAAPHPLVMAIHGGPVWHWRPQWLGRPRTAPFLLLLRHGYAVFFPNPRGSSGHGQEFVRRVVGDLGGADAHDCLSGLDHLVNAGLADPRRLGITGISYGGCVTSWLITQDTRFAAAVPVSPHTNYVTYHLISNIPQFVELFLQDHYTNQQGRYFDRSAVTFARNARTPTLNVCGALDRCTPPEEAVQFHNALLQSGANSALVIYPEEGHGVQKFPAAMDYAARLLAWFEEYMPANATA